MPDLYVPDVVTQVAIACHEAGGRALLVGGSVRDHVMGLPVKDWDIEVHGLSLDDLERVLRRVGRVDTVGKAFAVIKLYKHGHELDISIPRRDSKVGAGHTGIAVTGDPHLGLEEAARRRDLTVNALMVDLRTLEILDPWGGLVDIAARRLRPVDVETFLEDPLRALRAVQFMARLDFTPDDDLTRLCTQAALQELPEERLLGEWAKLMLKGRAIGPALAFARRTAILARVFPEHPCPPASDAHWSRAMRHRDLIDQEGARLALMMTVWLADQEGTVVLATLDRLKLFRWFGHPTRDVILGATEHLHHPIDTDADLRWLATRAHVETVLYARDVVSPLDDLSDRLGRAAALGVLHDKPTPLLHGRDLKDVVRPGPAMGRILKDVYAAQLDGDVTDHAQAKRMATRLASQA